jgi:uncharacterized repeat protein (TIGR01451 family)
MTYTLVINNLGPSTATSVMLTDTLPSSATFINATMGSGGTCVQGSVVTCHVSSLGAGASVAATIVVTTPTSPGLITNTASIASTTPDLNPENNTRVTVTWVGTIRNIYLPVILRTGRGTG